MSQSIRIFLVTLVCLWSSTGDALICREIFDTQDRSFLTDVSANLLDMHAAESARFDSRVLKRMNSRTIETLESFRPKPSDKASTVSYEELTRVLVHLREHPLLAGEGKKRYQREGVDIGYCFGRATYLHLLLLRLGLDKNAVVKLWAVGKQESDGEKPWGYHVAIATYVRGYGWMTIDPNIFKIQPLRHWRSHHEDSGLDGDVRIYVTDARKFGVSTSTYDRVQLGLDLPREQDWYRGFFGDILGYLRNHSLADLGLRKIERVPVKLEEPKPKSLWDRVLGL